MSVNTDKIAVVRTRWDEFAERYTATANKRATLQCAAELHANLQLQSARNVLEVAAGAGLGSLDIVRRMTLSGASESESESANDGGARRQLTVTDLSPAMVAMAAETLKSASTARLNVRVQEANGQNLSAVETGSVDRFVSNLCLQLTPDPDALLREARRVLTADGVAGFTIWGRPEFSGIFTIDTAASKELGIGDGAEHSNFALGSDLGALRARFAAAGFSQVRVWPYLCALELWSGEEYAKFVEDRAGDEGEDHRSRRFEVLKRMGDEWLASKGFPIGLEVYIITAKA